MTENSTVVDMSPTYFTDTKFFKDFSTEKFLTQDLGLEEEAVYDIAHSSFFRTGHDNYYLQTDSDKIIDNAITNATEQVLELHSVLLYLRDIYSKLTPEGDDIFFFTHFKSREFNELRDAYSQNQKIHPREFLSLLLLANVARSHFYYETKQRLSNKEEPSKIFVNIVDRFLESK